MNTTQQSTPLLLFLSIFKCELLSHFGSQFQWSKRKQILVIERAIRSCRDACYRRPPTFAKEQGQLNWQSLLQRSVQYDDFSSRKSWNWHNTEGWISYLFRAVCLSAPINQPTSSTLHTKCNCFLERVGDIAKRMSHL